MTKFHARVTAEFDGQEFTSVWLYSDKDPMIYRVFVPENVGDPRSPVTSWDIGRELFRESIDEHKLAGRLSIIIGPPANGWIQVKFTDENGIDTALVSFNEVELTQFHRTSHSRVNADQEIKIAMDQLLSKVNA